MQITSSHVAAATSTAIRGAPPREVRSRLTARQIETLNGCPATIATIKRLIRNRPPLPLTEIERMRFFGVEQRMSAAALRAVGGKPMADAMACDFDAYGCGLERLAIVWESLRPLVALNPDMPIPLDLELAVIGPIRVVPRVKRWLWADHPSLVAPRLELWAALADVPGEMVDLYVGARFGKELADAFPFDSLLAPAEDGATSTERQGTTAGSANPPADGAHRVIDVSLSFPTGADGDTDPYRGTIGAPPTLTPDGPCAGSAGAPFVTHQIKPAAMVGALK